MNRIWFIFRWAECDEECSQVVIACSTRKACVEALKYATGDYKLKTKRIGKSSYEYGKYFIEPLDIAIMNGWVEAIQDWDDKGAKLNEWID